MSGSVVYPRIVCGLTRRFKQRALDEGFDLVGVAASGPSRTAAELSSWLAAGMHGEMAYIARTEAARSDPRHLLEDCRSVVAVAMSYHTSLPESGSEDGGDGRVWVSRYAWGRDYHRLMKKRLVRLGRWLATERPGCGWRACVDTAPVLEREWAARAGLGWIGKNTTLLNRRLGSEIFLGVLLTDIELDPDRTVTDHCGKCTACLEACPTGAFPEPRRLDATKCIAYLTIEHRGEIPEAFQPRFGCMIAGCDICQEVCPWTRKAPADLHPEYAPHPHRYRPLLDVLEEMTEETYLSWRQGSPLNRLPYAQFCRNLAVARRNLDTRRR